jgi:hypothetical protein
MDSQLTMPIILCLSYIDIHFIKLPFFSRNDTDMSASIKSVLGLYDDPRIPKCGLFLQRLYSRIVLISIVRESEKGYVYIQKNFFFF